MKHIFPVLLICVISCEFQECGFTEMRSVQRELMLIGFPGKLVLKDGATATVEVKEHFNGSTAEVTNIQLAPNHFDRTPDDVGLAYQFDVRRGVLTVTFELNASSRSDLYLIVKEGGIHAHAAGGGGFLPVYQTKLVPSKPGHRGTIHTHTFEYDSFIQWVTFYFYTNTTHPFRVSNLRVYTTKTEDVEWK